MKGQAMQKHLFGQESGLTFFDRLVVMALLLGLAFWAMSRFGSALYDYYVMKGLARTVVGEYRDLDAGEVERRVIYELQRNHIDNEDGKFSFEKKEGGGYRVVVDLHIPLIIQVADYSIAEDKEWVLHFEAGK